MHRGQYFIALLVLVVTHSTASIYLGKYGLFRNRGISIAKLLILLIDSLKDPLLSLQVDIGG